MSTDQQSRRAFFRHNKPVFLILYNQTQIYFPFKRYDPLQSTFAAPTKTTSAPSKSLNNKTNTQNKSLCTRMRHMQQISTANRLHVPQFRSIRLHLLRNLSNDCNAHQSHEPQRWTNYRRTSETAADLSATTSDRNTKAKLYYTRLFGCIQVYVHMYLCIYWRVIEWYALNVYACAEQ